MDAQMENTRSQIRRRMLLLTAAWTVLLAFALAWIAWPGAAYLTGHTRTAVAIAIIWCMGLLTAIPATRTLQRHAAAWNRTCELLRLKRNLAILASSTNDVQQLAQQVLEAALHIEGFEAGVVYVVDAGTGALHLIADRGLSPAFVQTVSNFSGDSRQARLVARGRPVYGPQYDVTLDFDAARRQEGLRTIGVIPVLHDGRAVAVLALGSRVHNETPPDARGAAEGLAVHIGGVLARILAAEEQRRYEARLREAQKSESIGLLAGGIAHDFNNLLVGVLGNATLAAEMLPNDSPVQRLLSRIERSAQRAAELTRQLLAYSGGGKFIARPLNLSQVVGGTMHLLQASISKKAELVYHATPDLPTVMADEAQLQQVIVNLITNASEAMEETGGGPIHLQAGVTEATRADLDRMTFGAERSPGQYIFLEVRDTGTGMDAATYDRVFDPFFSTKQVGRGLGLPAVAGIVRGHHGAIDIHSRPGRGTTVRILLPISTQPATKADAPALPAETSTSGTILVVDDEEDVRHVAQAALESSGFRVLTAGDGEEALGVVRSRAQDIDAVVLDLTMPRLGGAEFVEQLRQTNTDLPVVLSSGYPEQDAVARFADAGLAGFVQKPYKPRALVAQVESAVRQHRRRRTTVQTSPV